LTTTTAPLIARHLSGSEIIAVREALLKGYNRWPDLDELAAVSLDISLEVEVGKGQPLKEVAHALVRLTESMGTTEMLIREAVRQRPGNLWLKELARSMGLAPAPFSMPIASPAVQALQHNRPVTKSIPPTMRSAGGGAAEGNTGGYEAMVRSGDTEKPGRWRRVMVERERPVCQILFDGDAVGTGFLVGPDRVMSNFHVFEDPKVGGVLGALGRYSARFDYRASDEGNVVSWGITTDCDPAPGYLDSSPKEQLDYVIVKLLEPRGEDSTPGGKRGWLKPDPTEFMEYDPTFVLQHPRGRTLEMAIGAIKGWEAERQREVYEHFATTDEGSSGSPCFSRDWCLRALHHRVEPTAREVNRAISMSAILERMGAVGTINLVTL
jgi:hypothetical protein